MQKIEELKEIMKFWQRELRLDHWDIEIRFAAKEELYYSQGNSCAGRYHRAQIRLKPESERTRDEIDRFLLDYEVVIVHELLHIKESVWRDNPKVEEVLDKDEWIRRLHEDSLDATAEALVRARHGWTRGKEMFHAEVE